MAYDDTATVSGSVVSINNGADDVPLKSCEVALPASLDGYISVDVVSTGKNLVNIPDSAEITRNKLVSNVAPLLDDFLNGKKGNFTISAKTTETVENANFITIRINYTDSTSSANVYIYRGSTHESGGITGTFSISSDPTKTIDSVSFGGNTGTAKCAVSEWQVEANAQATTYEQYVAPTTHTANLGRTIYGGTPDVVNGEGKETYGYIVFDGSDDEAWYAYTNYEGYSINISTMKIGTRQDGVCNQLTKSSSTAQGQTNAFWLGVNTRRFYVLGVYQSMGSTVEEFKAYLAENPLILVYPLDAETDFTFEPVEINSRLGANTMWSEQGDTELTYYKSGYGFTSVTIHKETPEGEPVEQTVKFHRIVYGGQADVVRGICEPKNLFVKDSPNEVDGYFTTTGFSTGNANAKTVYIPIVGGETYTVSKTAGKRFQIATAEVIPSNGASFTGRQANNTATSLTITASANDKYLWAWVFLDGTDTGTLADMLDSVQIEKGSSATEYVPGFTPFTFPPISMSTDEGENTLFANEGASAITYRKAVD